MYVQQSIIQLKVHSYAQLFLSQVAACEVDFSEEDSQAQIDSGLYPPRFNLIVNGERATKDHVAVLTFSGTQRKALEMEIALLLPTTYTAGGHVRTGSMSVDTESMSVYSY